MHFDKKKKKAFLFRFIPDSLEMCLETPSATELITVAFHSLTKCFPRIPAQLPLSPLGPNTLVECMKNKAARSDISFSPIRVCLSCFLNQME